MSVRQARREHTSMELIEWMILLDEQEDKREKWEYYAAQIAAILDRTRIPKKAHTIKDEKYLIKFERRKVVDPDAVVDAIPTEDEIKRRTERSKSYWFAVVGYNPEG